MTEEPGVATEPQPAEPRTSIRESPPEAIVTGTIGGLKKEPRMLVEAFLIERQSKYQPLLYEVEVSICCGRARGTADPSACVSADTPLREPRMYTDVGCTIWVSEWVSGWMSGWLSGGWVDG